MSINKQILCLVFNYYVWSTGDYYHHHHHVIVSEVSHTHVHDYFRVLYTCAQNLFSDLKVITSNL